MNTSLSILTLLLLVWAVAHGFQPVVGVAWYGGGAGIPVLLLVIAVLLRQFR